MGNNETKTEDKSIIEHEKLGSIRTFEITQKNV